MLERIERHDRDLNAYITVTADRALAQARAADDAIARGERRGPLHGVPLALKDIYSTAGIRTTGHSRLLLDWVPTEDATTVQRLDAAGAVLLGKLALAELATGSVLEGPFPPARNPWNRAHHPGISSSGSGAAVAAGLCLGSLGSDTGGSIRGPASFCGIVGIRPTYGLVSRHGVVSLCWSLDTAGPLARTVEDCAILLEAIAGHDPRDPTTARQPVPSYRAALSLDLRGTRIGVDRGHVLGEACQPETRRAVEAALAQLTDLGASVREIDLPMLDAARAALHVIHASESHTYHEARLRATPELFGPTVRTYFRLGALIGAADYLHAQRLRERFRRAVLAVLDEVDLIATPTFPAPADRLDAPPTDRLTRVSFTQPFSLVGGPSISVPCGFSSAGLPIGLQLAGRPFDEATVFRVAHAYERATPWHRRHPVL